MSLWTHITFCVLSFITFCALNICVLFLLSLQPKLSSLPSHKGLLAIGAPSSHPPPLGGTNSNNSSNLSVRTDSVHHNVFNSGAPLKAIKWTSSGAPLSETRSPSPWMEPPTPNILAALDSARDIVNTAPRKRGHHAPSPTTLGI